MSSYVEIRMTTQVKMLDAKNQLLKLVKAVTLIASKACPILANK